MQAITQALPVTTADGVDIRQQDGQRLVSAQDIQSDHVPRPFPDGVQRGLAEQPGNSKRKVSFSYGVNETSQMMSRS
jgi:hypothetical protein